MPESTGALMTERGVSGLKIQQGRVTEEFIPSLRGKAAMRVFREMQDNDAVIGAMLFSIQMLIRQAEWSVVPPEPREGEPEAPNAQLDADFLASNLEDMSSTWQDTLSEILSMLPFGFAPMEIIYKLRKGDTDDPKTRSLFSDGKLGWRKLALRAQESIDEWIFDDAGGIQGLIQEDPVTFGRFEIPIEKILLFRTTSFKNNPEGRSALRNAYRSWFMKKRVEELEGIGLERDMAGLPIAWVPPEWMSPTANAAQKASLAAMENIVKNIRNDEQAGIILPSVMHPSTGDRIIDFKLMSSGGRRQFDTEAIIRRYDQRMAMTLLADFIILGHDSVGSFALATTKTAMFTSAINSILDTIRDTMNRHAVPRLFRLNGQQPPYPQFQHSGIEQVPLGELGDYIDAMAGIGINLRDPKTLRFLRDQAGLPRLSVEETDDAIADVDLDIEPDVAAEA